MNINGSDNRKLNNDWTPWFYVSCDRIYYQNGNEEKIYSINTVECCQPISQTVSTFGIIYGRIGISVRKNHKGED